MISLLVLIYLLVGLSPGIETCLKLFLFYFPQMREWVIEWFQFLIKIPIMATNTYLEHLLQPVCQQQLTDLIYTGKNLRGGGTRFQGGIPAFLNNQILSFYFFTWPFSIAEGKLPLSPSSWPMNDDVTSQEFLSISPFTMTRKFELMNCQNLKTVWNIDLKYKWPFKSPTCPVCHTSRNTI